MNVLRIARVIGAVALCGLLGYFAFTPVGNSSNDDATPAVTIHLKVGYGLSTTHRPGWVPVEYRGRKWWVSPADLVPQPCKWTKTYEDYSRLCGLDEVYGDWVK